MPEQQHRAAVICYDRDFWGGYGWLTIVDEETLSLSVEDEVPAQSLLTAMQSDAVIGDYLLLLVGEATEVGLEVKAGPQVVEFQPSRLRVTRPTLEAPSLQQVARIAAPQLLCERRMGDSESTDRMQELGQLRTLLSIAHSQFVAAAEVTSPFTLYAATFTSSAIQGDPHYQPDVQRLGRRVFGGQGRVGPQLRRLLD